LKDREALRTIIFKNCDDAIHIPVNVPRLLWNAKEQFKIKPNNKSDLNPMYVMDKMEKLFESLCVIPGIQTRSDPLLLEAHENSTWLFKIYLRQLLSTKTIVQAERLSTQAFDFLLGEIKSRFEQSIVNPGEMVGPIGA
jgi:DNA-directed RNA polymerase II subunit RPB1